MKEMKIVVYSDVHSKCVQKLLFKLGYKWQSCGDTITNISAPTLYAHSSGAITFNTPYEYAEYTEADLESMVSSLENIKYLNKLGSDIITMLVDRRQTLMNEIIWVNEQIVRQIELVDKLDNP